MIRRILPTNDWDHDRDVAASALAAHQFSPPWAFPTVNELRCKLGHGCAGSGPLKTAAERVEEAAQQEAKIEAAKMAMKEYDENGKPKGPPGWPLGVRSYDKTVWTPKDVEELRAKLPKYRIKGPGSRAICWGQSRLDGPRLRLIQTKRGVRTVEQAAAICDRMEGCTHFWITVGPDYPSVKDWVTGVPYRAEFCRGPMVTVLNDLNSHSFVGIKKTWAREHALSPKPNPAIPAREGPLEAYGRDAGYFRSVRQEIKDLEEEQRLDHLKSEVNQLTAIEKKERAKDVKAQLKAMEQTTGPCAAIMGLARQAVGTAGQRLRRQASFL